MRSSVVRRASGVFAALCLAAAGAIQAQTTPLADEPPLATYSVPGSVALALSVEFPTANGVAHITPGTSTRVYLPAKEYQGYFNAQKCYTYSYNASDTPASPSADLLVNATYFSPVGTAGTTHICNVGSTSGQWSGNFLNWATTQTIDAFRSVLTGGYRVIDTTSLTVLEKAWANGLGGAPMFPDATLAAADVDGATPFGNTTSGMLMRIQGLGNVMRFSVGQKVGYAVKYFNATNSSTTSLPTTGAVWTGTQYGTGAIQGGVAPATGVNITNFSGNFSATVRAPTAGTYVFRTRSDDGVRLSINGTQVINNWTGHSATNDNSAGITLTAGQSVDISLDYFQGSGGATLQLLWQLPGSTSFVELGSPGSVNDVSQPYTGAAPSNYIAYDLFARVKVCDSISASDAIETDLCTVYGSYAKPEGLLQKYNKKLRFTAFGYLNDGSLLRDGGVLRAAQKFVGPMTYGYGVADAVNPAAEWSSTTGVYARSPDTAAATASGVLDSGVINYINKFGSLCLPLGDPACTHNYKYFDPVSELYYAAVRYFKGLGNVPEWSNLSGSAANQAKQRDGFPVITSWGDPIAADLWCQKNFILGIGDIYTNADKNVPGATPTGNEPAKPALVIADTNSVRSPTDAVTATNQVGLMEGNYAAAAGTSFVPAMTSSLGTTSNPWDPGRNGNSALIAGLAYDSHTTDIRNDLAKPPGKKVTIDTYWVDVMERQFYQQNNMYYLATKYGGFKVPDGFDPYAATTLPSESSWWNGSTVDAVTGQKRPNNYFPVDSPQAMRTGLNAAFSDIVRATGAVNSTSFVTALPQVSSSGAASFAAKFDSSEWSGNVIGSTLFINADGTNTATQYGDFQANLDAQTTRRIATWNPGTTPGTGQGVQFQTTLAPSTVTSTISATQKAALNTSYASGVDGDAYLAYLRGIRSLEAPAGAASSASQPYRTRAHRLGDIVNSKPTVVGRPSFPFSDATNPGYSRFKTTGAASTRPTVVYVGANDGMLHAIDGGLAGSAAAADGSELFAYVPNALFQGPNGTPNVDGLASLGNPDFVHHYMVDATASNFDVDFNRTSDGTRGPPGSWTPEWHTILIGGLGKGGKAFYALDITDPAAMSRSEATLASKVLWEFTGDPDIPGSLGYSYGEPAVAKTKKYGWVVVLPSGYNTVDNKGYLFILNPKTGALLETVAMSTGANASVVSGGLAHVDGFVIDGTDDTVDALYAGDLQGNVWRVDVTAGFVSRSTRYPAPLRLAQLTDGSTPGVPQPITTRPTIAVDPSTGNQNSGARYVMVGTGRLLASSDIGTTTAPGQTQSFYAIIDGTNATFNATAASGVTFPITRSQLVNATATTTSDAPSAAVLANPAGWYVDLVGARSGPAARMLRDASVDYGRIALPITQPAGNACAPSGVGQIYAFNFGTAQSVLRVSNTDATLVSSRTVGSDPTEVRFVSRDGEGTLNFGASDGGGPSRLPTVPNSSVSTRRLNWREVPTAD